MSGRAETITQQPLFWVDDCACGYGTEVRLDPSRVNSGLLKGLKRWRPNYCPHCGRRLQGRLEKIQ